MLTVALVLVGASNAWGSVTIGQLATDPVSNCSPQYDWVQPTVTSGNTYVVPGAGTITSWSTAATADPGPDRYMAMKLFRRIGDPSANTYQVVAHDGPHRLDPGTLNTFTTSIRVLPGDVLGVSVPPGGNFPACFFDVPGDNAFLHTPELADGAWGDFSPSGSSSRVNATSVFEPLRSNAFTVGAITRNKRKGTVTLNLTLPNPGELTASGNGVKASSAGARTSKSVGAGAAKLLIKAKGKKKKTLDETGKVKVTVAITYTPTGGDPGTQSVKVKLKKRL